jgi:hypothetical protein
MPPIQNPMIPVKKTVVIVEDELLLQQHLIEIIKVAGDITLSGGGICPHRGGGRR